MEAKASNLEQPLVSVVIPVMNESKTLASVIKEVRRIHKHMEVIVVANGSTDGSAEIAQKFGANVIRFSQSLGHDVGRSIGAQVAKGRYVLFTDGDMVISSAKLIPFIRALENGVDIALNKYLGAVRTSKVHRVILAKHALNACLFRSELQGVSLTTTPHAIKREALEKIGIENLAVPPKAQAIAIWLGLNIQPVQYINVGKINPQKRSKSGNNSLESLIIGDHLEAINWYLQQTNSRGNHTDLERMRELVKL